MQDLLKLRFLANHDLGLLALRVMLGLSMLLLHGLEKLQKFDEMAKSFADPLGIGSRWSLSLVLLAEVLGAGLLVIGLCTRFAALLLSINMAVAFFLVHKMAFSGQASGEMAFVYLAGYLAVMFAGAGRFSLDRE